MVPIQDSAVAGPPTGYELVVPEQPTGPIVGSLLRRTAAGAAVLGGVALAGLARSKRRSGKALALGALVPGGGYVYTRNPGRFLATAGAFGGSLVAWFGSGNILAPPAVWALAAADARRLANSGRRPWDGAAAAVPLAMAAATGAGLVARRRAFRAAQARGRERAAYLATTPRIDPRPGDRRGDELSTEDLAVLRQLTDRALQPLDQFDGYDIIDQFQTSAIRYQINFSQWALAMAQLHWTPAFQGYLAAAQRRLIDKITQPKVWHYWAWEQTWGNLSLDWDPMAKDNIMLSGYLGVMLGMYESNTGDARYRTPGTLEFGIGRRSWAYDADRVAAAVFDNMNRSRLTLFPCEPNWIYSSCNMTGINALLFSDRLHGTDYVDRIGDLMRRRLREEFLTPDGRVTAIRSARLGVTIPMLTSTMADCGLASMLHAFDPDLAQRCWAIVRREFVDTSGPEPKVALRGWDAIDVGNYQRGDVGAYAAVMWAAAEMGDHELYKVFDAALARRPAPIDESASALVRAMLALARFNPPGGHRAMILDGPGAATLSGPCLDDAPYPAVLVTSAHTDGQDLRFVLRPGNGAGRQTIGLARLRPGARYDVHGASVGAVTAGDDGRASIEVDLDGRTELLLEPAP